MSFLVLAQPAYQLPMRAGFYGYGAGCAAWLGGLYVTVGSSLSSSGGPREASPGLIKFAGAYYNPGDMSEAGAAYGLKKAGEDILPPGCTKRIYPSEMREIDAEKNEKMKKVLGLYSSFL